MRSREPSPKRISARSLSCALSRNEPRRPPCSTTSTGRATGGTEGQQTPTTDSMQAGSESPRSRATRSHQTATGPLPPPQPPWHVVVVRHGTDAIDDDATPGAHMAEVRATRLVAEEARDRHAQTIRDAVHGLHRRRHQTALDALQQPLRFDQCREFGDGPATPHARSTDSTGSARDVRAPRRRAPPGPKLLGTSHRRTGQRLGTTFPGCLPLLPPCSTTLASSRI